MATARAAPLTGVRVLEIGNFMAGPFCAMQLADLGADVVKVENPDGGDVVRNTG
ncbi:MAG: CoA transferase, partial [Candidatus Lustribacter sp.]